MGDGGGAPFPTGKGHQREVRGSTADIDDQDAASGGEACADGGRGGFIHQGHIGDIHGFDGVQEPLAVAPVAIDGGGQHQPIRADARREVRPDLLEQQASALLRGQPAVAALTVGLGDQPFEIPLQLGAFALQQAPFDNLATDQGLIAVPVREPDQARDGHRLGAAEGRQGQQLGLGIVGALMGHHRGGAAEVNGEGAGHWPKLKGNCRLRG